jgi:molybdopterin/thiamine biosynthesis adenylyltransferase
VTSRQLTDLLQASAATRFRPDQSSYLSLLLADARAIGKQTGLSLKHVESAALTAGILPERYSRNQKFLSSADQHRLLQSHVAIIGLGGLGGAVTEILARLGIGGLTLVDGDVFDESNLNRQLLSSPARLGEKKALAAASRVSEINPAVEIRAIGDFFSADNSEIILAGADLAVDCLDSIPTRFLLERACRSAGIPMVSAAIAGASGQATAVFPSDLGLQQIYGVPDKARQKGVEASLGTLPFAAVYMAAVECAEVAAILLGRPAELRNRLFLADTCDHTTELLELSHNLGTPQSHRT